MIEYKINGQDVTKVAQATFPPVIGLSSYFVERVRGQRHHFEFEASAEPTSDDLLRLQYRLRFDDPVLPYIAVSFRDELGSVGKHIRG